MLGSVHPNYWWKIYSPPETRERTCQWTRDQPQDNHWCQDATSHNHQPKKTHLGAHTQHSPKDMKGHVDTIIRTLIAPSAHFTHSVLCTSSYFRCTLSAFPLFSVFSAAFPVFPPLSIFLLRSVFPPLSAFLHFWLRLSHIGCTDTMADYIRCSILSLHTQTCRRTILCMW